MSELVDPAQQRILLSIISFKVSGIRSLEKFRPLPPRRSPRLGSSGIFFNDKRLPIGRTKQSVAGGDGDDSVVLAFTFFWHRIYVTDMLFDLTCSQVFLFRIVKREECLSPIAFVLHLIAFHILIRALPLFRRVVFSFRFFIISLATELTT